MLRERKENVGASMLRPARRALPGKSGLGLGLTVGERGGSLPVMKLAPLLLALLLVGCTSTGTHVMIGQARTPIDPAMVVVYSAKPAHYTAIAHVAADSGAMWLMSDTATTEEAMRQLKMEAARVGANGLIDVKLANRQGVSETQVVTATAVWVQ